MLTFQNVRDVHIEIKHQNIPAGQILRNELDQVCVRFYKGFVEWDKTMLCELNKKINDVKTNELLK